MTIGPVPRLPGTDFCNVFDIALIEQVQRRFTKRLRCLDGVAYTDRLQRLNLPSLELRRLHLDLVFCYKIVFGI